MSALADLNLDGALKRVTDIMIKNIKEKARKEFIKDIYPKIDALHFEYEHEAKKILKKAVVDALDLGLSITDYLQEQEDFSILIEKH